jgi:aminoglycoside phosphotransferase family enzyme/predicted kinase
MTDQQEVIAFLSDGAAYGLPGEAVRVIETHGALVFLVGDEAWKIKKPVKFRYMDFSTLERREQVCRRELDINRPNAPQIYLGVVPVTREADGTLALGGEGEPVEWAVHMRRFPDDALLLEQVRKAQLDAGLEQRLCEVIAGFHARAPVLRDTGFAGRVSKIIASLNASFKAAHNLLPDGLVQAFAARADAALEASTPVLRQREAAGFVRRCHGDLHLANIVVLDGEPVLFDAIEFSEELATIDVLYDVAFVLMDLVHEEQVAAANRVLNGYLRGSLVAGIEGLQALALFLGLRAGVRAMVTLDRAAQREGRQQQEDIETAAGYLRQAVDGLAPCQPRLVAVGGFSGTGKTTVAAALAPALRPAPGALHLRTDVERKLMAGVALDERLPPESYTKQASDEVYAAVFSNARAALEAGWPVVVDAAFLDPAERDDMEALARQCGAAFTGLWLEADEATLVARVSARTGDASDATADVVRKQLARGAGEIGWVRIDAGGTQARTLERCRAALD